MDPDRKERPDPDALLRALRAETEFEKKGRLKIFFGMSAGVGKTYDMLKEARQKKAEGVDVVIGIVETHGRRETADLLEGLETIPLRSSEYRGAAMKEMDIDAILVRKPRLVLVDELAHTNAPGSRHAKRYMDVRELLDNGVDVYTTVNVQHLESRAETVAQITGVVVRETVPDSIVDAANEIVLVDLPPQELLQRLAEGKVYTPDRSRRATENFFQLSNLTALRELALRLTAERVDHQLRELIDRHRAPGPWKTAQRLLVAVSGSPHSVSLIRWARRVAYSMDATWIAVHVETARRKSAEADIQLTANLDLARELGAETIVTADVNIVDGLLRVAGEQNATQLFVGKSGHFVSFRRTLLHRLLARSGSLDVYVVGTGTGRPSLRAQLPAMHSRFRDYVAASLVVIAAASLCYPPRAFIGYQTVSLLLLLIVSILPLRFSTGPIIAAAGLSALIWDFFFIPPEFTLLIAHTHDYVMAATYFVIAAVMGLLTARIRAQERAVRVREHRAVALSSLTTDLSRARSLDEVVESGIRNLAAYFEAEVVVMLGDSEGELMRDPHPASGYSISEKDTAVAAWSYWNEKKAGRFTPTLPAAEATYYPLTGPRYSLGVVGIKRASPSGLTTEQEALLDNFLRQISSGIEREQLHDLARRTMVVAESERLYKTLFDSLSHEFRTPVASLLGTAEQLRDDPRVTGGTLADMALDLHTAAVRLSLLVQNLLDMTRLESGLLTVKRDWCDVADLVTTAVRKLEEPLARFRVDIRTEAPLPLLQADHALLEQAIINILRNAVAHASGATAIVIEARRERDSCTITITDNGAGIPPDAIGNVFEKFFRGNAGKTGGMGLGLSIARGFVQAHGGDILCENAPDGGAHFTIRLPLPPSSGPVPEA